MGDTNSCLLLMKKRFEILLPLKYRPALKHLSKELGISMRKLIEVVLVLYIKELNEEYFEEIKKELGLK